MLKKLLACIAICLSISSKAQVQLVFPDSSAQWSVLEWDGFGHLSGAVLYYLTNQDTVINSVTYHQLFVQDQTSFFSPPTGYHAAIRTDQQARKVFIVPEDSLNEYILYDFSKSVGDTIFNVYNEYNFVSPRLSHVRIVAVDSLLHHGVWLKYFDHNELNGFGNDRWYEMAGAAGGLFTGIEPGTVSTTAALGCMSYNDTLYPYFAIGDCWTYGGVDESADWAGKNLTAYPSPFRDELTIRIREYAQPADYILTDANGRKVKAGKITSAVSVLDTSELPAGFYLLRVSETAVKVIK